METLKEISKVFEKNRKVHFDELRNILKCSDRKIRDLIMQLRSIEAANGFEILTLRGFGYELSITDDTLYQKHIARMSKFRNWNYDDQQQRVRVMIVILLLSDRILTLDEISRVIDVSRSTVLRDLELAREIIEKEDLSLVSQRHYGVKILGDEHSKRRMLNRLTLDHSDYEDLSEDYWVFLNKLSIESIRETLWKVTEQHDIKLTEEGMKTLVNHVTVMLYRLKNGNLVSEFDMDDTIVTDGYITASQAVFESLQSILAFKWNTKEERLFATQLLGCATIDKIPESVHVEISKKIKNVLSKLDKEFEVNFSKDHILQDALTYHVYPLLLRGKLKLRLKNPIRHIIPLRYMNSVIIALRFVSHYNISDQTAITPDEIGYLALHFASYFERVHQSSVRDVKHILYIASDNRSNSLFNKDRLGEVFPNGSVMIQSMQAVHVNTLNDFDVIVYDREIDVSLQVKEKAFPISYIISEEEIATIKHDLIQKSYSMTRVGIEQLFKEELFFVDESQDDYLSIIEKYALKMIKLNYAVKDFAKSVIERELKFSTVFESGVAAPHSMKQNAFIDSIAVIYLKNYCEYQGKPVKMIFLINIRKGHLFLYQDISDLIIWTIENASIVEKCFHRKEFPSFIQLVKERT